MAFGIARAAGDVDQRSPDPPDHRPRDAQEYDCLGEVLRAEAHAEGTTAPRAPSRHHLSTRMGTVACVVSQRRMSSPERSEERRVGKECRTRWSRYLEKKN